MAVPAIVPQSAPPAESPLAAVATALKQTLLADPAYGLPFARALDRALAHVTGGTAYEPYTTGYYRIQSGSRTYLWHYVSLHRCSCEATTPWCWHRALLHLLTAAAALRALDRCPRPTAAHVPTRPRRDLATILREADELC